MFVFIFRSPAILANITPNVTSIKMETGQPQTRFVNFMLQESQGCFLYSKMVLDLIERGYLVIKSSSFNVLPLSLSELFLLEFNLKFSSTRSFEKVISLVIIRLKTQEIHITLRQAHISLLFLHKTYFKVIKSVKLFCVLYERV